MKLPSISVVTPIYKDSSLASSFVKELLCFHKVDFDLYEVIFVIDGTEEFDRAPLTALAREFPFVKIISLSRNFGQHIALSAGYAHSSSDYTVMINVDQQDPPSQIGLLLNSMISDSYDIVYGLRQDRKDGLIKRITSYCFNWTLNKLTGDTTPLNVATLRIMNRKFLNAYNTLSEKSRYIPGLEHWLGFRKGYVPIEHQDRLEGNSSYNFTKRIKMAFDSIISFSDLPLKMASYLGVLVAFLGFALLGLLFVLKVLFIDFKAGYISTIGLILFIGGIQICVVGLASIYIGKILKEVQNRPLFVISEKINFDE